MAEILSEQGFINVVIIEAPAPLTVKGFQRFSFWTNSIFHAKIYSSPLLNHENQIQKEFSATAVEISVNPY